MIEMREAQAPGFKNCKVPMFDREINEELFLVSDELILVR